MFVIVINQDHNPCDDIHDIIIIMIIKTLQCGTDSTPMDGTACVGGPGNDEQVPFPHQHHHHHYNDHHQGGWDTLCPNPKIFIFWFFFPKLVISY